MTLAVCSFRLPSQRWVIEGYELSPSWRRRTSFSPSSVSAVDIWSAQSELHTAP